MNDTSPRGSALVTGGGRRIGAAICQALHAAGFGVLIHCRRSREDADALAATLNARRGGSARVLLADLADPQAVRRLAQDALAQAPDLSLLVNNASAFFPTPLDRIDDAAWDTLVNTNLRAPLLLAQALAPRLTDAGGAIVNLVDIYAERPLPEHPVYALTKAGLASLTRSLARDLAPRVRVNGVSPGAILWPEASSAAYRESLLAKIPLRRTGEATDIADAVLFLATAPYVTGQVLAVDGGRSLNV